MLPITGTYKPIATERHATLQAYYDLRASGYDETWHPRFALNLVNYISRSVLHRGSRCIDLCCGTGLVTFLLAQRVIPDGRVIGLDISDGMLNFAQSKLQDSSPEIQKVVRLQHWPVDEELSNANAELKSWKGSTDLITCASALVLLADPAVAVRMWTSYLAPRTGRLVLDVPHQHNLRSGLVLEAVAEKLGVSIPFKRSWVTGMENFIMWLENVTAGELLVERCDLVEQEGYSSRIYSGGVQEAEAIFERTIPAMTFKELRRTPYMRAQAKNEFVKQWMEIARQEDGVQEVDGVWLAVCLRT